ncbi:TonB-dependent Receptor Plug Domain [Granulicella rosea]|uniref:TonB-dependent Receptor Plug Domain n=1 Tax=Granulicella rosea TaxID=474952 RepID=A0A239K556_9BACT|nr:carboxypeptidase regulatory-like domain-containing protein [Granulicella rosea]SNT12773.1 TonB-dependent Receptor Plug Domain [Granulicella rosea]
MNSRKLNGPSLLPRGWQLLCLLVCLGCFVLCAPYAMGQADVGRIVGNVTDATGARIPGAKITALRVESNTTTVVSANKVGEYTFANLKTGHYNVTVDVPGFASVTQEGFELDDQSSVTADFKLQAGQTEQMIVTGRVSETVNTQTGEVSHVIDGETVRDLALNGNNYLDLLGTLPGSVQMDSGDAMANITGGATTNIVLNGVRATANGLYIDGMLNKDIGTNSTQFNNIGTQFIDHVKAHTSSFSAQFGQAAGPTVNVVTRSGTNSIHGSLFEHLRNNIVDAVNYFSRRQNADGSYSTVHQHLRFNDFGGALGGPIMKEKLFAFIGAEWKIIARNTSPTTVTLPLQYELMGGFASSTGGCSLRNVTGINTTDKTRSDYCNISPLITPFGHAYVNEINQIIAQAASYTGGACTSSSCSPNGDVIFELPNPYRNHEYVARVDYVLGKRQNMFARWVNDTHTTTNPISSGVMPTTPYHEMSPANNLVISHTYAFRNSFNEISAAAVWTHTDQAPFGATWEKATYGYTFQPVYQSPGYKLGVPQIAIYGMDTISPLVLNRAHTTYLQLQDIYTTVAGTHTLKVGLFFGRLRKDKNGDANFSGSASFQPGTSSVNSTGYNVADAMLGRFSSYTETSIDPYGFFRLWQGSGFVDDVWRALPKLSLNLGLRYEWMTPWVSQQQNTAAFFPELYDPSQAVTVTSTGQVISGSGNPYNGLRRAGDGVPKNQQFRVPGAASAAVLNVPTFGKAGFYSSQQVFMPRLGFAYDLFGNGQTAIRGGGGVFFDIPQGNVSYSSLNAPPYVQSVSLQNGNMDNLAGTLAQGTSNVIGTLYTLDPHQQRSYTLQYNVGIQQQLQAGMFLQINYVGNQGRFLLRAPDLNAVDLKAEDAAFQINQSVSLNSLRRYKGYSSIFQYRTDADSNYNGLQANLNRRIGKGRFTFAYTWSKALTTASADSDQDTTYIYSKSYKYSNATFDRRNIFSSTYIVSTPRLARWNVIARESLGGWMLSGTWRWQGGTYNTPSGTDALGVTGRANYAGYPIVYPHTAKRWVDIVNPGHIVNFSDPAVGQNGTTPKGIIVGPNLWTFDISTRKTFNVTERYRLTLSISAFNALNHPNFNGVYLNVDAPDFYTATGATATSATTDSESLAVRAANAPRNMQAGLILNF